MSRGLFFAAAATLTVLSSLTAASAMPASIGASLQPTDAAITRVQFYPYPYYGGWDERIAACAANFVSFDPTTGTYTTYEGFQVLCPFLRY